jgi:hypothetical protein
MAVDGGCGNDTGCQRRMAAVERPAGPGQWRGTAGPDLGQAGWLRAWPIRALLGTVVAPGDGVELVRSAALMERTVGGGGEVSGGFWPGAAPSA